MADETKGNSSAPETPASKPAEPAAPKAAQAEPSGDVAGNVSTPKLAVSKPAAPAAPAAAKPAAPAAAKPAAPAAAKPAAPAKPAGPVPEPWNAPLPNGFKSRFGSAIQEASSYVGQKYLVVDRAVLSDVLQLLRDDEQFDYCVDITAVHYPKREQQFDIVWILYSFARNERIRVKTAIRDGETAPSATAIWPAANWLERECYDMFGIQFTGHPDLKRILLPDGWKGFPLRKDYSILQQDKDWVHANLGIESGQ